jgi:hypothetical protein
MTTTKFEIHTSAHAPWLVHMHKTRWLFFYTNKKRSQRKTHNEVHIVEETEVSGQERKRTRTKTKRGHFIESKREK